MDFKRGSVVIKNVKGVYSFTYSGPGISNNLFYAGGSGKNGWRIRAGVKQKYAKIFTTILHQSAIPWIDQYQLFLNYNSRMDPDNTSAMIKVVLDTLKQERDKGEIITKGWVYDDSPAYCKGVMMVPDKTLPLNTFQFYLIELK